MHEAFCYALIHDLSADTPVCTSDVFLQRFAPLPEATIYGTPYKEVWQAGTAAERAVLDALSERLELTGEDRALAVFDRLTYSDPIARPALMQTQSEAKQRLNTARRNALTPLFSRWPVLGWGKSSDDYQKASAGVLAEATRDKTLCRTLIEAEKAHETADGAVENEEAALQRFAALYTHIVEARHLREQSGKTDVKTRFGRLWQAEQRGLPVVTRQ